MSRGPASEALPMLQPPEFPSGSKWGITQLELLTFPLEPQVHDFADLPCGLDISVESAIVLERLRINFGVEEAEWESNNVPTGYGQFYEDLAKMLPKLKPRLYTPQKRSTRSNTKLPSSSVKQPSSPWSVVRTAKRSVPVSSQSTPMKGTITKVLCTSPPNSFPGTPGEDEGNLNAESSPEQTPKRQRQSSILSPGLPQRLATPLKSQGITLSSPQQSNLPSSQTDSTFQGSDAEQLPSGSETDGDRPETDVTSIFRHLLTRICREHKDSNGYIFTAGYDTDTLTIPICGDFPKTTPDLIVRLERARKTLYVLDLESKRLRIRMTKQEKFAQEVAHLLGRANAMKSESVSEHYDVFLLTAQNMEFSVSTCRVSNKYLHRLQTRLPRSAVDTPVVHRYGPVDVFDKEQRIEAVCAIYKLMLDQVTAIS